jgi:hypothetical protein
MERKRRRMIEGNLCLFSFPSGLDKASVAEGIEKGLAKSRCGRLLGSGISLANDGTVVIEVGAYDCDEANDVISQVCRELKCQDYEMSWD